MPLLSRTLDPLLGIFTGVFAYYLHETNPRTAPPEKDRLVELLKWKWEKRNRENEAAAKADEGVDGTQLTKEMEKN